MKNESASAARTTDEPPYRDWREQLGDRGHAALQDEVNLLDAQTQLVRIFSTAVIPGYLQTPDYARHVFDDVMLLNVVPNDDVEAAVRGRLRRQHSLYDASRRFEFLLWEPVLLRSWGDPAQMRIQLERLAGVVGQSNIRLGIVPVAAKSVIPQNSFSIYDGNHVNIELFSGEVTLQTTEQAQFYIALWERLWASAAEGDEALRILRASK